jgi:hypothetical protein
MEKEKKNAFTFGQRPRTRNLRKHGGEIHETDKSSEVGLP